MEQITINGQRYNLKKNFQDFVRYTMKKLLETHSLTDDELLHLENKDYCKETFNLNFPLLSKDRNAHASDEKHLRYFSQEVFFEEPFYLCNDLYERSEEFFSKWLKKLAN